MTEAPNVGGLVVIRPTPLVAWSRGSQGLRLMSDLHFGSSQVDYDLIRRELKEAKRAGDRILIGGDVFDLILPSDRKRYVPSKVHSRLRGRDDLINAAVEWAAEELTPYADQIDMIGLGNHETAALHHASIDAVRMLVERLNETRAEGLRPIAQPGYTAYLEYRIREDPEGRNKGRYVVWFTHGHGRISSATGALKVLLSKSASFAADLYWTGHSHARCHCTEVMVHCGRHGKPVNKDVKCVVTGSYMVAYGSQSEASASKRGPKTNYASDAALSPHGLGGARVVLRWDHSKVGYPNRVEVVQ